MPPEVLAEGGQREAVALAAQVRACPPTRAEHRLGECVLLSPAFTGSGSARRALQRIVHLPANRHSTTLRSWRSEENASARCFIMTLRDPLERLESGVRYRMMTNASWNSTTTTGGARRPMFEVARQLQSADSIVEAWRRVSHPLHKSAQQLALSSNPPRSQFSMLSGHTCGATAVQVLCTRSLRADLGRLASEFGRALPDTVNVPRTPSDAALVHSPGMRFWYSCSAQLADTWLFYELCGSTAPKPNPCSF